MTPTDETRFIQLWNQGHDTATIGQSLGIPRGTVSSRASTLVRQGKIQPRPRGGAYPRQKALTRQGSAGVSDDTPGVSTRVSDDTPLMQTSPRTRASCRPYSTISCRNSAS
jgi:DNA-binding IclR family transcriptional regulator